MNFIYSSAWAFAIRTDSCREVVVEEIVEAPVAAFRLLVASMSKR
jgi:hypothetical protein